MKSDYQWQKSQKVFSKIIAKSWTDSNYKNRVLNDPLSVLKEEGINIPEGVTITVVEDTPSTMHWVIPTPPVDPLSEEEIELAAMVAANRSCQPTCPHTNCYASTTEDDDEENNNNAAT